LDGDVPAAYTSPGSSANLWDISAALRSRVGGDRGRWEEARAVLDQLQTQIDQEAAEFGAEATALKERDTADDLPRLAAPFMDHNLERFDAAVKGLGFAGPRPPFHRAHPAWSRGARVTGL